MHSSKVISQLAARSLLALSLSLLCHVQVTWAQTSVADNPFQPLGAVFNLSERVVDSQARLVMFRPQASTETSGVTRINVNGAYHTSLMAGAYAVLCLAPGPVALDVRPVGAQQPASQQADMNTQTPAIACAQSRPCQRVSRSNPCANKFMRFLVCQRLKSAKTRMPPCL
jgi:hypothetical protein